MHVKVHVVVWLVLSCIIRLDLVQADRGNCISAVVSRIPLSVSEFTKYDSGTEECSLGDESVAQALTNIPAPGMKADDPRVYNGILAVARILKIGASLKSRDSQQCDNASEGPSKALDISSTRSLADAEAKLKSYITCSGLYDGYVADVMTAMSNHNVLSTCGTTFAIYVESMLASNPDSIDGVISMESSNAFMRTWTMGEKRNVLTREGVDVRHCKSPLVSVFYTISSQSASRIVNSILGLSKSEHKVAAAKQVLRSIPILNEESSRNEARQLFLTKLAVVTPDDHHAYAPLCRDGKTKFSIPDSHTKLQLKDGIIHHNALGALIRSLERISVCQSTGTEKPADVSPDATNANIEKQALFADNLVELTNSLTILGVVGTRISARVQEFIAITNLNSQIDLQMKEIEIAELRVIEYIGKVFESTRSHLGA